MAQEVVAMVIVALAALNLARIWGGALGKKSSGCGKCGGCDSTAKAPAKATAKAPAQSAPQLVQLQMNLRGKGE